MQQLLLSLFFYVVYIIRRVIEQVSEWTYLYNVQKSDKQQILERKNTIKVWVVSFFAAVFYFPLLIRMVQKSFCTSMPEKIVKLHYLLNHFYILTRKRIPKMHKRSTILGKRFYQKFISFFAQCIFWWQMKSF